MLGTFLLLIAGLAAVVIGADALVEGSSSIARKAGVSEFIIGLTIVGMGTSAPELVVSLVSSIEGRGAMAVGNVVGSNIFNTLLILGITALIMPIGISRNNQRQDMPMNIFTVLLFTLLSFKHAFFGTRFDGLSHVDGMILLAAFAAYMWRRIRTERISEEITAAPADSNDRPTWLSIVMILVSLAALVFGGDICVKSAAKIAEGFGLSERFISITLLAGGTSLPELATCVAAAAKKKGQLALGNIIGSNIFNLLLIMGTAAAIRPLSFSGISLVDMGALLVSAGLLYMCCFTPKKNTISRTDGILLLLAYVAYMSYIAINH